MSSTLASLTGRAIASPLLGAAGTVPPLGWSTGEFEDSEPVLEVWGLNWRFGLRSRGGRAFLGPFLGDAGGQDAVGVVFPVTGPDCESG